MTRLTRSIAEIGAADLVVAAAGITLADLTNNDAWRAGAAVAIGLITFFRRGEGWRNIDV
jgi:hypothetical protein